MRASLNERVILFRLAFYFCKTLTIFSICLFFYDYREKTLNDIIKILTFKI